ncbi:UDP-glucose 4-epimerase GalE [candidate division WWE3 bacterium]|uniref:UDP-glucose 4-epimerase n=1 Tax=candidate division WWE3 bacterium TaxID=2053526 RepID=A0A955RR85_UNCKA|nr:UDP-glucose 4-epimerase GalE [candidate division WWE3 bacterium]
MQKILVTGGAGYIGSITSRILSNEGFTPVIVDNLANGNREAVGEFEFHEADLRDYEAIHDVLSAVKPDGVIHFAALKAAGESMEIPEAYYENNVGGSANLFKAMIDLELDNVVFSSTAAVYGDPEKLPVDEDDATIPTSVYGHSKLQVEEQLDWLAKLNRLSSIRLRYFNVAGALEDGSIGEDSPKLMNLIPRLIKCLQGEATFQLYGNDYETKDGTNIRDYIHVVDLAKAHVMALQHLSKNKGTDYINIAVGEGYSNMEIIDLVEKVSGQKLEYDVVDRRAGDPAEVYASNEKAKNVLGWEPQYGLEEIIEHAWKWHSTHPHGYKGE